MAPPDFSGSVNPISTRRGRLCHPYYYWHPRVFRPSYGPATQCDVNNVFVLKRTSTLYFLVGLRNLAVKKGKIVETWNIVCSMLCGGPPHFYDWWIVDYVLSFIPNDRSCIMTTPLLPSKRFITSLWDWIFNATISKLKYLQKYWLFFFYCI